LRYGLKSGRTARQLIKLLSEAYRTDPDEVAAFVEPFARAEGVMDVPLRHLPKISRLRLSLALFYAFPCDLYLFQRRAAPRLADMRQRCAEIFRRRSEQAGMILATPLPEAALRFGGKGGVLYNKRLVLFETAEEAVYVFKQLPKEEVLPPPSSEADVQEDEGEGDGEALLQ
jgi:ABC-type polysaccharide/polyol phosphate transport system ATPase subunit